MKNYRKLTRFVYWKFGTLRKLNKLYFVKRRFSLSAMEYISCRQIGTIKRKIEIVNDDKDK